MNNITYTIHFDGSSRPNPGMMTAGYVIQDDDKKVITSASVSGGEGTSNEAEYIGLLSGILKALELGLKHVQIFGDSQLIINQVLGKFKCKKPRLIQYRDEIQALLKKFYTYELAQVPRNQNKQADKLTR
jgi:ribonuclease HI